MQKYAVLMAGGSGTRLWPLSKEASPKQFIPVEGDGSMLVQTIDRICTVVQPEQCFIVTNRNLADITRRRSENSSRKRILYWNPTGKILRRVLFTRRFC